MSSTIAWTLDEGLQQNEVLKRLTSAQIPGAGRQVLQTQKRAVSPAAIALLRFIYREVVSQSDITEALRDLRSLFQYEAHAYSFVAPLDARVTLRGEPQRIRATLQSIQFNLRRMIARLLLGAGGRMRVSEVDFKAIVVHYRGAGGYIVARCTVTPDTARFELTGTAILVAAQRWVRFCPLCGRLFFKVKRQLCCGARCYKISQGRDRPRKGDDGRGRPRFNIATKTEVVHTEWLASLG